MDRDTRGLHHSKQTKVIELGTKPTPADGDNGDIAMVKAGYGGVNMYVKAFGAWHLFKSTVGFPQFTGWNDLEFPLHTDNNLLWRNYEQNLDGTYTSGFGGEYAPAGWKVTPDGLCHLRGVVKNYYASPGVSAHNSTISTLPKLVRPLYGVSFRAVVDLDEATTTSNNKTSRLWIKSDGTIALPHAGSGTSQIWVILDGFYWFIGDRAKDIIEQRKGIL